MTREILTSQFTFTHFVLKLNAQEVSGEESLQAPQSGGNCLNWVLGHIVASRDLAHEALGLEPVLGEEEACPYRRGAGPLTDTDAARPLETLLAALDASQERLLPAIQALSDEALAAEAPFSPTNNENETVATLLGSLTFHEAYHAGQTGILRRLLGKSGQLT